MYPVVRLMFELWRHRAQPLHLFEAHGGQTIILPGDLDPWLELNNGRTLTLYDMARMPLFVRLGMVRVVRAKGWGISVAGAHCRYRRRVRLFERLELVARLIGWDERFLYVEHAMWRRGEAVNHLLVRLAVTRDRQGIVPPQEFIEALGYQGLASPPLPKWVRAWIEAEALRPWPPELQPPPLRRIGKELPE